MWLQVDFGSGTGSLTLALAHLFPTCRFVAVDAKAESIRLLQRRAQGAGRALTPFLAALLSSGISRRPLVHVSTHLEPGSTSSRLSESLRAQLHLRENLRQAAQCEGRHGAH